jgi:hypothetical protein
MGWRGGSHPPRGVREALLGKRGDGDRLRGTNERGLQLPLEDSKTAPDASGVLVIDETLGPQGRQEDRAAGKRYLCGIGETDDGVVSIHSLWAAELSYYPPEVKPYTPACHLE